MSDKLKMHTPNKADENFKKLAALFPNSVTETIDEFGEVVRAIDKDVLMQEISTTVVEGKDERYQFTWPDKKKSILLANAPISKTLRPCKEESVNFDTTENLYIEGDNLEVLKLLQETYLGKIKMIYIDPPYNTGSDFVYEDDFAQSTEEYLANSGQFDNYGNRLVANLDSNGRYHTDWLNMIYPRLKLAKDLLSEDGVIFLSIDDNEQENLKRLCDEIFGAKNFVATVIDAGTPKNNSKFFSVQHEYAFCYAKNIDLLPINWFVEKNNVDEYMKRAKKIFDSSLTDIEKHKELLELVKYPRFYDFDHYTYVDEKGIFRLVDMSAPGGSGAKYDIIHPITKKSCKQSSRGWAYTEQAMNEKIKNNMVYFGEDENQIPQQKYYLHENTKQIPRSVMYFDPQKTTKWLKKIGIPFDFVKPLDYMTWLLSCYPSKDTVVLDFFSGSATTAHAVMQLNAEDEGTRKFIMVQLPEETSEKSEAYRAGFKNICEIGKERIRRAAKKIAEENPEAKFDGGFRVLKCDSSNMKDVYYNPQDFNISLIGELVDNIKEDRTPEDLLFQVMLDLGVLLSSKIEETTIAGKKVFNVAEGFLIACFDADITEEVVTEIAKQHPYYFVTRDNSMANDNVATNFEQIFATYSPDTVRKVL